MSALGHIHLRRCGYNESFSHNSISGRYTDLGKIGTNVEKKFFNPIGRIPIISNISGSLRYLLAKAQIVAGLVFAIFSPILSIFSNNFHPRDSKYYLKFAAHGFANVGRAAVENIPFLGNLLCYIYDKKGYRLEY